MEREKGFESVVSRGVSGTYATLENSLAGSTRPLDASGRVATETVAGDTVSGAHGLPSVTPDLFLAAGFIVADLASRSLAEPSILEQVLRRAVHQAAALREQLPGGASRG
jgi:hypothetical protein